MAGRGQVTWSVPWWEVTTSEILLKAMVSVPQTMGDPGSAGSEKPDGVEAASDLTGSFSGTGPYAGGSWNDSYQNSAGAWDFGTSSQNPALVYNDYDGSGKWGVPTQPADPIMAATRQKYQEPARPSSVEPPLWAVTTT